MRFILEVPVLTLVSATLGNVSLSWLDMDGGTGLVRRYQIWRSESGAAYTLQGYSTGLTYSDTASMTASLSYQWFILCEYNNGIISGRSNYVTAQINTEYLYAADASEHLYSIDIRNRLVPALIADQNFSTEITSGFNAIRIAVLDNLLFLSIGTQSAGQIYAFDWSGKTSLVYKGKFPTANLCLAGVLVRGNNAIVPYINGYEAWDLAVPATPVRLQQLSLGSLPGNWHPDGCAFDPDGKVLWQVRGDGNTVSMRYMCAQLSDLDVLSSIYTGQVTLAGNTTAHADSRVLIQRRMPANPNVLWELKTNNGWGGYALPLTAGASPIGVFSPNGNPASSSYGRCYIMDNRYMVMCQYSTSATTYGVVVWDLIDPTAPVFVSNIGPLNVPVSDLAIVEDTGMTYAYLVCKASKNIVVVNITDIANPVTLATVNLSGLATDMRCCGAYMTTRQRDGYNMLLPPLT
jgi:hypothetical protein